MDNVTNATGVCFLSYSRERADEAALLVSALRDHGVPTWQDISHMPSAQTEEELREILSERATASAILFITPEVEDSEFIRNVEAPLVFERYRCKDGFSIIVVAAGGLDYGEVGRLLGDRIGPTDPSGWNTQRVLQDPMTQVEADQIADVTLSHRLAAISRQLGPKDALKLALSTRADLPIKPGSDLAVDLTHRFAGRIAHPGAWEHILRGFRSIRKTIQKQLPERLIECSGPLCLPAAVALGVEFMPLSRLRAAWIQEQFKFGISPEIWGLHVAKTASDFKGETHLGKVGGTDLALVVSVTHDPKAVMDDVRATFGSTIPFRAIVHVHAEGRRQVTASEATGIAHLAVNTLGDARSELKTRGAVHLFLAVPAGLAFLIGQLLNTVGEVQTYEHVAGQSPSYIKAALLRPSDT
jgi:hypothetical protein